MIASGTVLDRAVRFIHENATTGIHVDAVAAHVRASRRWLDAEFVKHLGHTPHEEIIRVQFAHVERLLQDTDLPLHEIAFRAGFRHPEYLSAAFKRRYGVAATHWRAGHRRQHRSAMARAAWNGRTNAKILISPVSHES